MSGIFAIAHTDDTAPSLVYLALFALQHHKSIQIFNHRQQEKFQQSLSY